MNCYHLCVCITYRHCHLTTLWRTVGTQGRSLVHRRSVSDGHDSTAQSYMQLLNQNTGSHCDQGHLNLIYCNSALDTNIPSDDSVLALIARKAGRSLHSGEHYSQQRCSALLHLVFSVWHAAESLVGTLITGVRFLHTTVHSRHVQFLWCDCIATCSQCYY